MWRTVGSKAHGVTSRKAVGLRVTTVRTSYLWVDDLWDEAVVWLMNRGGRWCVCLLRQRASVNFAVRLQILLFWRTLRLALRAPPRLVFSGTVPPPGIKRPRCEYGHSPLSKAGLKNEWKYTSARPACLGQMLSTFFCTMDPCEILVKPADPFPTPKKVFKCVK